MKNAYLKPMVNLVELSDKDVIVTSDSFGEDIDWSAQAARKILCKKESKQTKGLRSRHNEGFPLDNPFPERRLQYARLGVNTVVVFWEF